MYYKSLSLSRPNKVIASLVLSTSLLLAPNYATAKIPFSFGQQEMPSLAPMLEQTTPSVVRISVEGNKQVKQRIPEAFRYFFGPRAPSEYAENRPFQGLGSGVIIDADEGYVVTNYHVIDGADDIVVTLKDGRQLDAKKIGGDKASDIALLKIKPEKLTEIKLANSDKIRVGDFAIAIGNPFGLTQTVTSGIISALGRSGLNIEGYEDFIQTDAAINSGNSGGALVNLNGELIGINTAIYGPNGGNVGIGFAIPSNMMSNLVEQIIEYGEVKRGVLGIKGGPVTSELADAMNLSVAQGAFISEVTPDSGASEAGLKAGDVITSVNGIKIKNFSELRSKIATQGAGKKVKLGIIRDGDDELTVTVTLKETDGATLAAKALHQALEGATLINGETVNNIEGVKVTSIDANSPAAQIGLEEGDVILGINRRRIENLAELRKALNNASGVIALNIQRGNSRSYILIR
ncbi:DegQ family serine endoprotease [Flocculibacter collagenilyticus]|uniref:DegQ family serine endoprotease n=1 Tax=Flocculibacter collagenilyticus TaxID=2744479 RepID=UPI0018F40A71|nr:DegQ family serine endoprotease [Flocculibacter collagenilyticus]